MSNMGSVFLFCFVFGLGISLVGGYVVKVLVEKKDGGVGHVQLAFLIRLFLDLLGFIVVTYVYRTIPAYLGLALGLVSYKNILIFNVIKESWQRKRKE